MDSGIEAFGDLYNLMHSIISETENKKQKHQDSTFGEREEDMLLFMKMVLQILALHPAMKTKKVKEELSLKDKIFCNKILSQLLDHIGKKNDPNQVTVKDLVEKLRRFEGNQTI